MATEREARDLAVLLTPADAATRPHTFIWTPDRQGAVLFPAPGYALLAGTEPFMATAVPEGTDEARARFTRYARKRAAVRPELLAVAVTYSPAHTAWSHPADVAPNTAACHQLELLRDFTNGAVPATDFAHTWWQARRASRSNGSEGPWRNSSTGCSCFLRITSWNLTLPGPPISRP